MKTTLTLIALATVSMTALAKLPAPAMDDAAKAKAEEAKAKTAHGAKVEAYKTCLAQNRSAANYFKTAAAA
ncbi:MAG: hypothetical protein KDF54_06910, partial [Hydrogenophaga sp.]|nr:hypothetical protein [Hydrogenophaga sp.]